MSLRIDGAADGGPFTIIGDELGPSGVVTFNGTPAVITSWTRTRVKGVIPHAVKSGEVVVTPSDGSPVQNGTWPQPGVGAFVTPAPTPAPTPVVTVAPTTPVPASPVVTKPEEKKLEEKK